MPADISKKVRRRVFNTEEDNTILKGYLFKYKQEGTSKHKRKIIVCQYPGCTKTFAKSWNFRDHAMVHEGLKPYYCEICWKPFTQKGNMLKHQRVHIIQNVRDRKTNWCKFCSKSYTEKYNLRVRKLSLFVNNFTIKTSLKNF